MPSPLDALRAELDQLDRQLVAGAARRLAITQRIADAKADTGRPRFDRARERQVYERARANAAACELDPRVAERLMAVLVDASHARQDARLAQASLGEARNVLVVGGGGQMGQRFVFALQGRGHSITVLEVDDGQDRAALTRAADVVLLAVPMRHAVTVARELAPFVRADALLADINSLKRDICQTMGDHCAGEVLGLHPMFGPTVASMDRQKVVLCPVRAGPVADWLRAELGRMGLEVIEAAPDEHDKMMAVVQVLVHFNTIVMGEALRRTSTDIRRSLAFTSPIYRLELAFVGRLFAQDPDLYAEIEMANPYGAGVRAEFAQAVRAVATPIESGDRAAFRALFQRVADWFAGFEQESMRLSDLLIDTLVQRP